MNIRLALLASVLGASMAAQTTCPPTPAYSVCEFALELSPEELQSHPNPYESVTVDVEFRSPRFRTLKLPAYWDGGNRMMVRFAPTEAGSWDYRVTGNLPRLNGAIGRVEAVPSDSPGFVRARNVHHWGYSGSDRPHLWMGDTSMRLAFLSEEGFRGLLAAYSARKFNHLRISVIGGPDDSATVFPSPDRPEADFFRRLDQRILALNRAGVVADLVLGGRRNHLADLFPTRESRERYLRYLVGRYAAMHIIWQGVEAFEEYDEGRELLREIGGLLRRLDPYAHPRSTGALTTSGPLASDGWMDYIVHNSVENAVGAVEHQLYAMPFVNIAVAAGPGGDAGALRKRLWNAAMNGQYPTLAEGPRDASTDRLAGIWFDFFSTTRHWELEPYFDVDGGRAVALELPREEELEGVEYVVYAEKPGPVEIVLQRQRYDVVWIDPATGERSKRGQLRGDRFKADTPGAAHDWVLHISRESKKAGMLRSYKFESRRILLQEVEQSEQRAPYEIVEPSGKTLTAGRPVRLAAKLKRETRATRSMYWLWMAEVSTDAQGYRVLATEAEAEAEIPIGIARRYPAILSLRLAGMNANGKVYFVDRVYTLNR